MGQLFSTKDGGWSEWSDPKCGVQQTRACNNPRPGFWGGKKCVGDKSNAGPTCTKTIQNTINSQGLLESQEILIIEQVEGFSSPLDIFNVYDHSGNILKDELYFEPGYCETDDCYYDITLLNQVDSTAALFQQYVTSTREYLYALSYQVDNSPDRLTEYNIMCSVNPDDGLGNICEHIIIKNMNDINKVENYFKYWLNKVSIPQEVIDEIIINYNTEINSQGVMTVTINGVTYKINGGWPEDGSKCTFLESNITLGIYDTLCTDPVLYLLISLIIYKYKYNKELIPITLTPEEIEKNKTISTGMNLKYVKTINQKTCEIINDPSFIPYDPSFNIDAVNYSWNCNEFNSEWTSNTSINDPVYTGVPLVPGDYIMFGSTVTITQEGNNIVMDDGIEAEPITFMPIGNKYTNTSDPSITDVYLTLIPRLDGSIVYTITNNGIDTSSIELYPVGYIFNSIPYTGPPLVPGDYVMTGMNDMVVDETPNVDTIIINFDENNNVDFLDSNGYVTKYIPSGNKYDRFPSIEGLSLSLIPQLNGSIIQEAIMFGETNTFTYSPKTMY